MILGADDYPVRPHEVVDRSSLLQELGIADHTEGLRGLRFHDLPQLRGRADRYGALRDDDRVVGDGAGKVARDRQHMRQIRGAILSGRRTDGDEDHLGALDRGGQLGHESESLLCPVAGHELSEAGLVNRQPPLIQGLDLRGVAVDADDVVAVLREAGPHDESDITGADYRQLHLQVLSTVPGYDRVRHVRHH